MKEKKNYESKNQAARIGQINGQKANRRKVRVVMQKKKALSEYHRNSGKRHRGSGNGTVGSNQPRIHLNQASYGDRQGKPAHRIWLRDSQVSPAPT